MRPFFLFSHLAPLFPSIFLSYPGTFKKKLKKFLFCKFYSIRYFLLLVVIGLVGQCCKLQPSVTPLSLFNHGVPYFLPLQLQIPEELCCRTVQRSVWVITRSEFSTPLTNIIYSPSSTLQYCTNTRLVLARESEGSRTRSPTFPGPISEGAWTPVTSTLVRLRLCALLVTLEWNNAGVDWICGQFDGLDWVIFVAVRYYTPSVHVRLSEGHSMRGTAFMGRRRVTSAFMSASAAAAESERDQRQHDAGRRPSQSFTPPFYARMIRCSGHNIRNDLWSFGGFMLLSLLSLLSFIMPKGSHSIKIHIRTYRLKTLNILNHQIKTLFIY